MYYNCTTKLKIKTMHQQLFSFKIYVTGGIQINYYVDYLKCSKESHVFQDKTSAPLGQAKPWYSLLHCPITNTLRKLQHLDNVHPCLSKL